MGNRSPGSITYTDLHDLLDRQPDFKGLVIHSKEVWRGHTYLHASAIIRDGSGSLRWLDSEKLERQALEGPKGSQILQELQRVTINILGLSHATSIDDSPAAAIEFGRQTVAPLPQTTLTPRAHPQPTAATITPSRNHPVALSH